MNVRAFAVADINQHIHSTNEGARGIVQGRWIGNEMDKGTVGPLSHRLHAADFPLFFQRYRHGTLAVGHWPAIGPIELPGAAELALSYLGAATPQLGGSLVIERYTAGDVGCVDGCG